MGDILRAEGICKTYHTGMVDTCFEKMRHKYKKG